MTREEKTNLKRQVFPVVVNEVDSDCGKVMPTAFRMIFWKKNKNGSEGIGDITEVAIKDAFKKNGDPQKWLERLIDTAVKNVGRRYTVEAVDQYSR